MTTYNIDWSDAALPGKAPITLPGKNFDSTSTSLVLTGKGVEEYGEIQQENFIRLMEHFASSSPPANVTVGQLWFDYPNAKLRLYKDLLTWDVVPTAGEDQVISGSWEFPTPTLATNPATKQYVDIVAQGLQTRPAVEIVVTAPGSLGSFTYNNGTGGVGATLTATVNTAFPTIDGVTLTSTVTGENGVLIAFTGGDLRNGRYNLTQVGSGTQPWVLTRCALCDEAGEIPGSYTFVKRGTTYAGTGWVQTVTEPPPPFTVGTDPIFVTQFSGAGALIGGAGISITGNIIALQGGVVTPGTYQSVTVDTYGRVTAGATLSSGQITTALGYTPVNKAGDTMTGALGVPHPPTAANHAATKLYVDSSISAALPPGSIIMWSPLAGPTPAGWAVCDGTSGTPDLRNKFIVCAGPGLPAGSTSSATFSGGSITTSSGGAHSHITTADGDHSHGGASGGTAITIAQMPSHAHFEGSHSEDGFGTGATIPAASRSVSAFAAGVRYQTDFVGSGAAHNHTISLDGSHIHTATASGTHDHTVTVAYYALIFIMKL